MSSVSYDEVWSYSREQIEEYLADCKAVRSGNAYAADACTVTLETLSDREVGSLALPRTRVRMEGPGAEAFHQGFLLHFLSGGG